MREQQFNIWKAYAGYFREHRLLLVAVMVAGAAQSFTYVPLALLLRRIFDTVLPARDLGGLWIAIGELLAIQLASLMLAGWIRVTALRTGQDVLSRLRRNAIEQLYQLPRDFHTGADVERLHLTLVFESTWIEGMNNALTASVLPAALSALVLFYILFRTEPRYAVILAVLAPTLFTINRLLTRRAWFRQEGLRRAFEAYSRGVRFAISAMDLTRFQAAERYELSRQSGLIGTLRRVALELARFDALQQLIQSALLLASTLAVLLAGGWAVANGGVSTGQIMAFYVIAALFATQARTIVEAVPGIRLGMRAFARMWELLELPDREPYLGTIVVESIASLRVDHVRFGYPGGGNLLEEASFEIRRGERAALLGANGSGKSTLLFLLGGIYRPSGGALFVNDIPYDLIDIRSLRRRMAFVPQNPFLFAGTIHANLTYGLEAALSAGEIDEALSRAGALDFVRELPQGLETEIGENGVRLSGGQRQRLVIARALLRQPEVLILDEPTNHLDEEGIANLMESLDSLPSRPAVLIISHESRVLRHAGTAWRLEDGHLERFAVESRL